MNTKAIVVAALIAVLAVVSVVTTVRQSNQAEQVEQMVKDLSAQILALGVAQSTQTARTGTGTDFTEVGFDQVRTGKFNLVSSTTAGGVTHRLAFQNRTGQDVVVNLADLTYYTTGAASSSADDRASPKNSRNTFRVFATVASSTSDNTPIPDFGALSGTTTLLGMPWVIYNGSNATSTSGLSLAPVATTTFGAAAVVGHTALKDYPYGTTTVDGLNRPPEDTVTSVVIRDGEVLQFVVRNAYGNANCGSGGSWVNAGGLQPCESATSSQIGFVLNVLGEYEYRNPLK